MSFADLFDALDPGPRNRINEIRKQMQEMEKQASDISGVPAERMGPSDSTWATGVKPNQDFFNCWSCGTNVQLLKGQNIVVCPFCQQSNEVFMVSGPVGLIETYEVKSRPVVPQADSEYEQWLKKKRAEVLGVREAVKDAVKPRAADLDNPFRNSGRTTDDDGIIDVEYEEV